MDKGVTAPRGPSKSASKAVALYDYQPEAESGQSVGEQI